MSTQNLSHFSSTNEKINNSPKIKSSKISSTFQQAKNLIIACLMMSTISSIVYASNTNAKTITDANIAAIVVAANNIDISAAKIAIQRSNNPKVKQFAKTMITDHTAVLNAAVELVTRIGITPVNNELVVALAKQSNDHESKLNVLTGEAFDALYIAHEVAYHQAVISVIEKQLIPSATNQELKQTLISVLPAFKAHLKHCKMIQEEIS